MLVGVRVAGYRVRTINDVVHWTLIGERDPMLPQMFYPVDNDLLIRRGDVVVCIIAKNCFTRIQRRTSGKVKRFRVSWGTWMQSENIKYNKFNFRTFKRSSLGLWVEVCNMKILLWSVQGFYEFLFLHNDKNRYLRVKFPT